VDKKKKNVGVISCKVREVKKSSNRGFSDAVLEKGDKC